MIVQYLLYIFLLSSLWLHPTTLGCPTGCRCTQTGWGQRAFCQGGSLTDILSSLTKDIHQLHVTQATSLRVLRNEDFKHLKDFQITKIFLTKCSIQEIQGNVFSDLESLLELSFAENNINIISNDAFSGLSHLKRLDLSSNKVSILGNILYSLNSLEHLDFSSNLLSNLQPGSFLSLTNLVTLKLGGNQLQKINSEVFKGLDNLKTLDLRNCDLMSVDSDVFNVVRRLKTLDLGKNRLSSLPQSKDFLKLKSLENLYLDNNEITVLQDSQFEGMTLRELNLAKNRIGALSQKTFEFLEVQKLDLSYNVIDDIAEYFLLKTAKYVESLNMAGNPIRLLPVSSFQKLHRLYSLNLSSCALEKINEHQFRDLNNLRSLDISFNSIQYIPIDSFVILNKLQTLNIQNNPWHCDCYIKSLKNWLQEAKSYSIMLCVPESQYSTSCRDIRCTTPSDLYNRQVLRLKNTDIEKCQKDKSESMLVNTQIAIVIPCVLVSVILLVVAICLWRRGRTKEELRKVCVPVEQESSHLDFEKKPRLFDNSEIRSLNESDKGFVFRNYFQTMVANPSRLSYPTISQRDVDSVYSSQPSLYSSCSRVHQQTVGIESSV